MPLPGKAVRVGCPLKDLRNRRPNAKWIEVLILDREVKDQFDDEWDKGRVVAKFALSMSNEAFAFAVRLAKGEIQWCGGVLIR